MIRINLLGTPKAKRGKHPVVNISNISVGEGPNVMLTVLILVVIAAVGNGYWYWKLQQDGKEIQKQLQVADVDYQRLTQVKQIYEEREKQKEFYKRRVEIIDKLRSEQSGPVELLSMLGKTVNSTDELWLNNMKDDGSSIKIDGVALSVHAVADLMRNLEHSGYFKSVEIKESYQDEKVKDMQAFVFTLVCEKQPAHSTNQQPNQAAQENKS
jgi:Tfp pilus assembly protein PilN